jgi:hypothetical protein
MSSVAARRRDGVTDHDHGAFDLCAGPLPSWAHRQVVTIEPGQALAFDEARWNDTLVVIDAGELEIECQLGGRRRFPRGAVLWLAGINARALHCVGDDPTVLVAVSRQRAGPP